MVYFERYCRYLKPLSVTKNVVVLQTDDVGHVGQNSSAHVACVVGLQTDAVVVTETRLSRLTRKSMPMTLTFFVFSDKDFKAVNVVNL